MGHQLSILSYKPNKNTTIVCVIPEIFFIIYNFVCEKSVVEFLLEMHSIMFCLR